MKKLYYLLMILGILSFTACSEDDSSDGGGSNVTPSLTISEIEEEEEYKEVYSYSNDKLVSIGYYYFDNAYVLEEEISFEYDNENRISKITSNDEEEEMITILTVSYDGDKIKDVTMEIETQSITAEVFEEKKRKNFLMTHLKPIPSNYRVAESVLTGTATFVYSGNLITKMTFTPSEDFAEFIDPIEQVLSYDGDENLKKVVITDEESTSSLEMTYDTKVSPYLVFGSYNNRFLAGMVAGESSASFYMSKHNVTSINTKYEETGYSEEFNTTFEYSFNEEELPVQLSWSDDADDTGTVVIRY
ncbi:hypothetical protein V6R21_08305 [Limibacter armeniacum]|uniref:hypothetical protein n=1 Tax=Limibacter armeniacum TaxID=466084 RepID=UPI002FE620A0